MEGGANSYLIVATVLTACGIETIPTEHGATRTTSVATVLTACGIETTWRSGMESTMDLLQQYLPLAVLKHDLIVQNPMFHRHQ